MEHNFKYWYDTIADMPEKDKNGNWYDMETGIPYDPSASYGVQTQRYQATEKIKHHRNVAKKFGGRALIGSARQKNWAEGIRARALLKIEDEGLQKYLATCYIFSHCAFWIDAKESSPAELATVVEKVKKLIIEANTLLYQAESQIKIDENKIVIERGNSEELMEKRNMVLEEINKIRYGNINYLLTTKKVDYYSIVHIS